MRVLSLIVGLLLLPCLAAENAEPVIIDTDAGSDDLMAIAFLLARADVRIDAITVANGLAHVQAGAANILRLLELAGRRDIPVFVGRETPLQGHAGFPAEWRRNSDHPARVQFPSASRKPQPQPATDYLVRRLQRGRVRILALGPLTNLGEALQRSPAGVPALAELVIMGGAVRVPGNLADGGYFRTDNKTAEWNIFIDPLAARIVFTSGVNIRLIPLDATNKVPIDLQFLKELRAKARTPLGRLVAQILESDRQNIAEGIYYAWDPLAAVALVQPNVVTATSLAIRILPNARTAEFPGGSPNARVAVDASAAAFRKIFLGALSPASTR